jgi:MFS family permease
LVCLAFIIFGIGFGSYYAIIYPLVGLSVKKQYRGTAYAMVSFVQAIGMTIIPELSALIIEK